MFNLENQTFIYLSLLIAFSSMVFYAIDKFSMAFKSIVILTFLLIFFSIFPFKGATDVNLLNPQSILNGFSNTSLITVISLLILGQGVVNTRVLDGFISNLLKYFPDNTQLIIIVCLFFVLVLSAFINNTPVVIIFIPILQSVVKNSNQSIGKYLMPLSFVAILGGMITIIGSSTNLLVSDSLKTYSNFEISFFEFAIPGSIIAFCGLIYVVIFSKFLLTDRSPISNQLIKDKKNNFITKIIVNENSNLIGKKADEDKLEGLENSEILMIQRGEHAEHTPFYSFVMEKGDILVISTSREQLTSILSKNIGSIESFDENEDDSETKKQVITEAMVTPSSSLVGNTIENVSFRYRYDCIVIGLQRKSKIITTNMGELPLEPGDTLLIQGDKKSIKALRTKSDLLPMEWTTSEIQNKNIAKISIFIFLCVIIFGAFEILPLVVASLIGVVSMIASKVLSLRQALRSVDNNLLLLIVTSLALGKVIQVTGAATFLSEYLLDILDGSSPLTILICFYALVSITTNFISNNACAVLFAPIAIDIAEKIDVDPKIFAIALIFSVNTSFATPLAYQTNLLVMGPGHYKFIDYVKFGLPLTILCWVVFFFVFPFIYKI
ncbi:MAG: SLC13 family permease [Rickettsiales bacterium]|nr:SLC13 family permease [Rickettsiales bacterium]